MRSLSFICDGYCQPPVSAYPGPSGEQPLSGPIHGISARKVYPLLPLPATTVGSYPTFSPLLCLCKHKHGGYFLWHFLVSQKAKVLLLAGYVALRCPDFPILNKNKNR